MMQDIDRILFKDAPIKAKLIASKLGLSRKEVNSFLHGHPELYQQDSEYRWTFIKGEELTLPPGWVTGDEFERIFQKAGNFLNTSSQNITITFSSQSKTMISCIARLLALGNQLVHMGKNVTMDFTRAEGTRSYLDRAGFFDHLDEKIVVLPERPEESAALKYKDQSDTLVEFGTIDTTTTNDDLIKQLTNKFVQQSSADYQVAAFTVFSELIGNVLEHSNSPLHGFAGLQKYGGSREHIQAVVSDSGAGIVKTLRPALKEHYPSLYRLYGQKSQETDIGLVKEAMKQGGVSRFGGARGLGFKSSREQAIKFNANFSVRQENFCLNFLYKDGELIGITEESGLSRLLGTHICFDFYLV
jgi:hypothetical protein